MPNQQRRLLFNSTSALPYRSGLVFWLDATRITGLADGTALNATGGSVPELSGSGAAISFQDTYPTTTHTPTYRIVSGYPAVDMRNPSTSAQGRLDVGSLPSVAIGAMTMYLVVKARSAADQYLFGQQTSGIASLQSSSGTRYAIRNTAGTGFSGSPYTTARRQLIVFRCKSGALGTADDGGVDIWVDGQQMFRHQAPSIAAWLSGTLTALYFGTAPAGTTSFNWTADWHEGMVYNAYHTDAQVAVMSAYLASKWGVSANQLTMTDNVVVVGDSLSNGLSADGRGDYLRTKAGIANARLAMIGEGGKSFAYWITNINSIHAQWRGSADHNVLNIVCGTNDLGPGTLTPAQVYANLQSLVTSLKAVHPGWYVIVNSVLPRQDAGLRGGFEADRLTYNDLLRAGEGVDFDALSDVGADTGNLSDPTNTTYFSTDKLHLTIAGYNAEIDSYTLAEIAAALVA